MPRGLARTLHLGADPQLLHQSHHALAGAMHPASFEHRVNARTSIDSRGAQGRSAGFVLRAWHLLAGARLLPVGTRHNSR